MPNRALTAEALRGRGLHRPGHWPSPLPTGRARSWRRGLHCCRSTWRGRRVANGCSVRYTRVRSAYNMAVAQRRVARQLVQVPLLGDANLAMRCLRRDCEPVLSFTVSLVAAAREPFGRCPNRCVQSDAGRSRPRTGAGALPAERMKVAAPCGDGARVAWVTENDRVFIEDYRERRVAAIVAKNAAMGPPGPKAVHPDAQRDALLPAAGGLRQHASDTDEASPTSLSSVTGESNRTSLSSGSGSHRRTLTASRSGRYGQGNGREQPTTNAGPPVAAASSHAASTICMSRSTRPRWRRSAKNENAARTLSGTLDGASASVCLGRHAAPAPASGCVGAASLLCMSSSTGVPGETGSSGVSGGTTSPDQRTENGGRSNENRRREARPFPANGRFATLGLPHRRSAPPWRVSSC